MHTTDPFEQALADSLSELSRDGMTAMGSFYDLTALRLVRYATTLTRHQHDAEDAVQTALVKIALRVDRIAEVRQPWPYILRVVRNEALQIARRQQRVVLREDLSDLRTRTHVDQAELNETHQAVWIAMRNIPPIQAEVVALKIWEAMTFAQIAEVLKVSPNTAASRYRYGIEKLNHALAWMNREVPYE